MDYSVSTNVLRADLPIFTKLNSWDRLQSDMTMRNDDIVLELEHLKLSINPRVGGSITSLMIKDQNGRWASVLRNMPADSQSASDASSFVMLPWTNRIKDAVFIDHIDGTNVEHQLESNCSDGSAIHGIGRDLSWRITDRSPITARLVLDSRSFDDGSLHYPFQFGAVQRFEIGPKSVQIDLSVTNLDTRSIPAGCGHHPYIHRQLFSDADDLRVKLDVAGRYPAEGCIPTGEPIEDSVCQSLRAGNPIGNPGLDDVFAGFAGSAVFDWAASNVRMRMSCTENLNHLVIYTPRTVDGEADECICVEPVTMVNDGLNRYARGQAGSGVIMLEPNETLRTRMALEFSSM